MASRLLNSLGRLGLGVAVIGSVVNTALYNGFIHSLYKFIYKCMFYLKIFKYFN